MLRITFLLSLTALLVSVCALVLVQRRQNARTPAEAPAGVSQLVSETQAGTATPGSVQGTVTLEPVENTPPPAPGELAGADPDAPAEQRTVTSALPDELRQSAEKAGLTDERIGQIRAENTGNYYYDSLAEDEQILYAELYHIMTTLTTDVYVSAKDADRMEKVQNCVMNDHPEIFYISGYYTTRYTLGEETVGFSFTGRYLYDAAEIERRKALIESYISACVSGIDPYADDYAKVRYVYDYVITRTSYNLSANDNQNICSVMIGGESVCQGYAKAAQMLLNRLGVKTTLVTGTVQTENMNGPHAWNLVFADGNWYYLDVTWGDASFRNGDNVSEGINYDYLLTTTADISRTHTIGSVAPMPVCDHIDDNYYVREGAYFTEPSLNAFEDLVARRRAEGSPIATFKCANEDVYNQMMAELIDNSRIFDYIYKAPGESLSFTRSPSNLSFTVWF